MNFKIYYPIILLLIISTLHLIGVFAGLYDKNIPIDIPQHILAGIMFGIIWLWWLQPSASKSIVLVSTLSFVALLGVAWEFLEFAVWNLLPTFANSFKFYSPTVGELLGDMVANLAGGLLVGFYVVCKKSI